MTGRESVTFVTREEERRVQLALEARLGREAEERAAQEEARQARQEERRQLRQLQQCFAVRIEGTVRVCKPPKVHICNKFTDSRECHKDFRE